MKGAPEAKEAQNETMAHASRHLRNQHLGLAERGCGQKYQQPVTLASVPPEEWDQIASGGFDAVWFMGVWERSPAGIEISMRNQELVEDFKRALPDFTVEDNAGSPYCVRRYVVNEHLGWSAGLAAARSRARWPRPAAHPRLCAQPRRPGPPPGSAITLTTSFRGTPTIRGTIGVFRRGGWNGVPRGRDPYFPAWPDVLQLNAFQPGLRQAVVETIAEIAGQCDGIRCDMAMLMLNDIFERTWGPRAGSSRSMTIGRR